MIVSYKTQIEDEGWNLPVADGATSGTTGKGLKMEAIAISLLDLNGLDVHMEYKAYVENAGWMPLQTDGGIAGTVGLGWKLEALRIRLTGIDAKKYSIKYRVHVENIGWQLWCKDDETAGTEGLALRAEAIEIRLELIKNDVVVVVPNDPAIDPTKQIITDIPPGTNLCASYSTHIEDHGWGADVTDGRLSGRVGQGLRIEAIRITLLNIGDLDLSVSYQSQVENLGVLPTVWNGATSGTTDQGLRLEAFIINLTGADADKYSIWYRVHVQNEAWQEWRRDGEIAGTIEESLRAEAIQIIITLKSDNLIRTQGEAPLISLNYRAHIQNLGWQVWVKNGMKSGTTGLGLRMEALEIKLSSLDSLGLGVEYRTHVENVGWQEWLADGKTSGTTGLSLRVEAIEIRLTGVDAVNYTIKYRGHIENEGWTGWKKNGETLGTTEQALRAEAISIVLIKNENLNIVITNEIKNKAPYLQVWASEFPKADVLLHDMRLETYVLNPKLTIGINKTSGFTFTIDPTHPGYNSLRKMYTTIYVYEIHSNMEKKSKFEGRILTDTEDFNKMRSVTCEGELSYLLDSTQRPATYENVTPEQWLTMVLDNHNMAVTPEKRIHMGICTMVGDGSGLLLSTSYRTHIENQSWLTWVKNGERSGTIGDALRMEALELKLESIGALGLGVTYRASVENQGWGAWVADGATAGTVGLGLRLEALEIKLTGADAIKYSVQYRVHVQNQGWQDWKQDGETAGTVGLFLQAEAIVIIIVAKSDTDNTLKDSLFRENDYISTYELIKTTMLDVLGGVLVIERIGSLKFMNYLENYGSTSPQPIEFGVNLLDYSKVADASGIITALIPVGKEIDGRKLDISSVNSDSDFIYNEVAVNEYGWIFGIMEWPKVDNAVVLLELGKNHLETKIKEGLSLELTAIDLNKINVDIKALEVGDMVPCISKPHGIDTFLSVSQKDEHPNNPESDRITLGGVVQSLTDRIAGPLGGGITGIQMANMTANGVKNMEFVSNELSFLIKLTNETVAENETVLNETVFNMSAFEIDLVAKQTQITEIQTDLDAAELKITPTAIVLTVTSSTTYINDLSEKITESEASTIAQTAENVRIGFNGINNNIQFDSEGIIVNQGNYRIIEVDGPTINIGTARNSIIDECFETLEKGAYNYSYDDYAVTSSSLWNITGSPRISFMRGADEIFQENNVAVTSLNYVDIIPASTEVYVLQGQKYSASIFATPHYKRNSVGAQITAILKCEIYNNDNAKIATYTKTETLTTSFVANPFAFTNTNPEKRLSISFSAPTGSTRVKITLLSASSSQWVVFSGLAFTNTLRPVAFIRSYRLNIGVAENKIDLLESKMDSFIGSVNAFATLLTPENWLVCNGAAINRTTYSVLFGKIGTTFGIGNGSTTYNLPDLRGEFIRGNDDSRGVDSGRVFGSSQDDGLESHAHVQNLGSAWSTAPAAAGSGVIGNANSSTTQATGGTETRPRNVSLRYYIKYQ